MRNSHGRLLRRPPEADYWFCRCSSCRSVYRLPKSGVKPLRADIGKAKCPECGGMLVRTQCGDDTPIRTITRGEARLKDAAPPQASGEPTWTSTQERT